MPLDSHVIVPCVLTDGGRLFAPDPVIDGMEVEFKGWWWQRVGSDPAWPCAVFKVTPQEVSRGKCTETSRAAQA